MKAIQVGIAFLLIAAIMVAGCSSSSSTTAPVKRTGGSAEAVHDSIYLIGGMDGTGKTLAVVEEYNTSTHAWTTKKPLSTARIGAESVVWNDEIYVIGGRDGDTVLSSVEKYSSSTNSWTTLGSMPTARWNPMLEVVDGKIYVIGGISGTGNNRKTLATVEVYSIEDNTWSSLPDAPFSRQNGASAVIGRSIYIVSGRAGTGEGTSTDARVNIYDTGSGQWSTGSSLPEGRAAVRGSALSNGKIAIAGGAIDETLVPGVLVYSADNNRWEQQFTLKTPRTGHCCVGIGTTLYVLSGVSSADPVRFTTDVESFSIT